MRILVAGHWGNDPDATAAALNGLATGINTKVPRAHVTVQPFGVGAVFAHALGSTGARVISVDHGDTSTYQAGRAFRAHLGQVGRLYVEGGHHPWPDAGLGFLAGVLGEAEAERATLLSRLASSLGALERFVQPHAVYVAASTRRPLVGMASVLAIDPELRARSDWSSAEIATLTQAFAAHHANSARMDLPIVSAQRATQADQLPGSGAGGGVGAVLAAVGVPLHDTGRILSAGIGLERTMDNTDLLVVVEPHAHSPVLAESQMGILTECASHCAIPVVAVVQETSLSSHERAQWGIHGVITHRGAHTISSFDALGQRLAHTWIPR
ncbi:glycerate kinase [Schaalia suimastitidis]|uniref:glycerate kinase n=1 Tax=Schaalia suimastitidis TaxID=121163 RepID=UPI0003FEA659|nr:glycerate kinase [Schaalia suimastitidis]